MRYKWFSKRKKGSSSIMVMMVMVVLVVFGVLALMSSYSDLKLSRKSAKNVSRYYELDSQGQKLLPQIDEAIIEASKNSGNVKSILISKLSAIKVNGIVKVAPNGNNIDFDCKLGDKNDNKLAIGIVINCNKLIIHGNSMYKVMEWKQLPTEFKYDKANQLWNGDVGK